MAKKKSTGSFVDTCVIYFSKTDECWIAHSLRTDQIGTGNCIINALADSLLAVSQVAIAAKEDSTLTLFREAPRAILNKAKTAEELPREMYEIAHKMAHGSWPDEIEPAFHSKHHPFVTEIYEAAVA